MLCSVFMYCDHKEERSFAHEVYDITIEEIQKKALSDKYMEDHITKYWYEGHEYLLYRDKTAHKGFAGLVHNPNCPCNLNEK